MITGFLFFAPGAAKALSATVCPVRAIASCVLPDEPAACRPADPLAGTVAIVNGLDASFQPRGGAGSIGSFMQTFV